MSKLKILQVHDFYGVYLNQFYSQNPNLKSEAYEKQHQFIMNDCFGWANFWQLNLSLKNDFEVIEVICNAPFLQKQWSKEHNFTFSEHNWLLDILEAQIAYYKPDILFSHDFPGISADFRHKIKNKYPFIKLILGWDGLRLNDAKRFEGCDIVLSCLPDTAKFYSNNTSIKGYYYKFGFEQSILNKIKQNSPKYDLSFTGSVIFSNNGHKRRLNYLSHLAQKKLINTWVPNVPSGLNLFSRDQLSRLKHFKFDEFKNVFWLCLRNNPGVFGINMYQILADSKITFNCHIDVAGDDAVNIRLTEATGVGTCLLTDWKPTLKNFFEPDYEVVTYKSPEECVEKVNFLLNNEQERIKIAKAGQKRTLENYTMQSSIFNFADYLKTLI